jgi:retron-type reverse transcriptase
LLNYIDKNKILWDSQYGFRKKHSTSLALIDIYDKISSAIDRREFAVGIFLDLFKAFDTVNHNILLDKLNYYGICGLSLDWFKSYLSNRFQYVEFNGCRSSRKLISCGVPQGSYARLWKVVFS